MSSVSLPLPNPHGEKFLQVMVLRSRTLKRVIYLECGKDFIDILLSLFIMPIGAILKLLKDAGLVQSIDRGLFKMYTSLENLDQSTLSVDKSILIDPSVSSGSSIFLCGSEFVGKSCIHSRCSNETLMDNQLCTACEAVTRLLCRNSNFHGTLEVLIGKGQTTCYCGGSAVEQVDIIQSKPVGTSSSGATKLQKGNEANAVKGFVRENSTFMIKEDLSIVKSSTISSVALLKSWNVDSFQDLDTKEIRIGRKEGLLLVQSALVSSQPLTDVFESFFFRKHQSVSE